MIIRKLLFILAIPALTAGFTRAADATASAIVPLSVQGEDFVDAAHNKVRFWGVNVVAYYPDHAAADGMAKNLSELQINLVRPHHLLRPSTDWNPGMVSGALLSYQASSRQFDADALDRFDYLNAALRRQGIYLSFSLNWTRRYLPGDVSIMTTDADDEIAWSDAMTELNGWSWKKGFDIYKSLPVIDERTAKLNEEFTRNLLTHVNPYTGIAYGKDPQVLTIEVMNEASTEYAIVCGNRFPDYWQKQLEAKWHDYAAKAGIDPGDLYKPVGQAKDVRANFLRGLDEAYFNRMKAVVRDAGCNTPMMFSNLWRGENELEMQSRLNDVIENHIYQNPRADGKDDFVYQLSRSAVAGKPFFVGELNQSENVALSKKEAPFRSMLPLATAAYGSLQNWSGVEWFAWNHGGKALGANGRATEQRSLNIGDTCSDGVIVDHLRTTGILFRRSYLSDSAKPVTVHIDQPFTAGDYNGLMRGKYPLQPGWQDVHALRKTFDAAPPEQAKAEWLTNEPEAPRVSDTGQIVKDPARQQLTVAAPMAEAFSGTLDANAPRGLKVMSLAGSGFATAILVANDRQPLTASRSLIISRTATESGGAEIDGPSVILHQLATPAAGEQWRCVITRTRGAAPETKAAVLQQHDGNLTLPEGGWTECELHLENASAVSQ